MQIHGMTVGVFAAGVMCLSACPPTGGDDDDSAAQSADQTVLADEDFDSCERGVYWPAGMFPVLVDSLDAPDAPYLITEVGAELFFADDFCLGDAGLHVNVWVSEDDPSTLEIGGAGIPAFQPLVDVLITAEPPSEGEWSYGSVILDEPVLVETAGRLWIGYDNANESVDGQGACLAGCVEGGENVYQWIDEDTGWTDDGTSLPLFKVTVQQD